MGCSLLEEGKGVCPCDGKFTRQRRCPYWEPSRNHKYARCRQFQETRALCPLPRSACATCPHHNGTDYRGPKPPPPACVETAAAERNRAYMREYMRRKRAAEREFRRRATVRVEILAPGHPDYIPAVSPETSS